MGAIPIPGIDYNFVVIFPISFFLMSIFSVTEPITEESVLTTVRRLINDECDYTKMLYDLLKNKDDLFILRMSEVFSFLGYHHFIDEEQNKDLDCLYLLFYHIQKLNIKDKVLTELDIPF